MPYPALVPSHYKNVELFLIIHPIFNIVLMTSPLSKDFASVQKDSPLRLVYRAWNIFSSGCSKEF